ncbi:hypothetical protein [Gordonia insulae]|uniref:hypothetical protein n=1 Tax=Gordonia insulae TaxID=2420509 RepID=UPI001E50F6F3|nr:hypothetical protein [Gordonia insulae]
MTRRISRAAACMTVVGIAAVTAALSAAPADAAPGRSLRVEQVPNVGITVNDNGISGGFVANLAATATTPGTARLTILPWETACRGNLANARAAVTWRNEQTNRTDDAVFPVCRNGKPAPGPDVATGVGRISFTTTIIGRTDQAFTVVPGTGWFYR